MYNPNIEDRNYLDTPVYLHTKLQSSTDIDNAIKEYIKERLADNELTKVADEAMGDLYNNTDTSSSEKISESIVKAIILGGKHLQVTVGDLIDYLKLSEINSIKNYIYKNGFKD